jgi:hypothetical protein
LTATAFKLLILQDRGEFMAESHIYTLEELEDITECYKNENYILILKAIAPCLTPQQINMAMEYTWAGEAELALDQICCLIAKYNIKISQEIADLLRNDYFFQSMNFDLDPYILKS